MQIIPLDRVSLPFFLLNLYCGPKNLSIDTLFVPLRLFIAKLQNLTRSAGGHFEKVIFGDLWAKDCGSHLKK